MNLTRAALSVVLPLALAAGAGALWAQDKPASGGDDGEINVSITLESASQSRAAVANLVLPIGPQPRSAGAPLEQERRFEPADFARPNRLEAVQLEADDLPRGARAVAVRCQAFINPDGGLGEFSCLSDNAFFYEDVVTAVIDAVSTQRFVAARVDGQSVRVLMNFAVYIDCTSGSCIAVAARNHGYHLKELGLDYVDPQPIVERDTWYEGFDYKMRWVRGWMPRIANIDRWPASERLPYVIAAEIDAEGNAGQGCLYWLGISGSASPLSSVIAVPLLQLQVRTKRALEAAVTSLGKVRYVPGMIDGEPAALRLYEQSVMRHSTDASEPMGFGVADIVCR
jgi:hypothetical protein